LAGFSQSRNVAATFSPLGYVLGVAFPIRPLPVTELQVLCFRQRSTQQITQPCDPRREDVELYKHSPDDMKEPQGLQGIKGSQGLQGLDEDRKSDSDARGDGVISASLFCRLVLGLHSHPRSNSNLRSTCPEDISTT